MEVRINEIDESDIDTILAEDIDFEGVLTFKKPLMIKGKFKGEIKADSALFVGKNAEVQAKIEAENVASQGKIEGNIVARSKVELYSTAKITGDINCPNLVIESGSVFDGNCQMSKDAKDKDGKNK